MKKYLQQNGNLDVGSHLMSKEQKLDEQMKMRAIKYLKMAKRNK